MKRFVLAGPVLAVLLSAVAGCEGGGGIESLPSARPSVQLSVDRTESSPRTTSPRATAEPTRTRETTEPTETTPPRETATAEPTRAPTTRPAEPPPAEPTPAEPTRTTTAPATVEEETAVSPAAAAATDTGAGGPGLLAWLLLIGLFAAVIGWLVINRSRRGATWRAEASAVAAETRLVVRAGLRPVLFQQRASERARSWPPVRDDLAELVARWAELSTGAPDTATQAEAAQIAGLLRDLMTAVDAENQALATARDWHLLRPEVDAVLDALTAVLPPSPAAPFPPGEPGPAAYPG